jgi:hypothetical protein
MTSTELLLRDSLQIETAKTARELEYIVRNIEARHAVEGIAPVDLAAWENLKRQHVERVYRVITA